MPTLLHWFMSETTKPSLKSFSSVQKKSFGSNWSLTKKYWLTLFLVGFVFLISTRMVFASAFSPTVIDLNVMPGETVQYLITVQNTNSETVRYQLKPIGVTLGEGGQDMNFNDLTYQVSSWISSSESELLLSPGEIGEITVSITPSSDAQHQSLTVGMLVTEQLDSVSDIQVSEGFISLAFITIGDDLIKEARILDYSANKDISSNLPISFFLTIKNEGEQIVQPVGMIKIENIFGREVALLEVNPDLHRVADGQIRTFSAVWDSKQTILPPLGVFKARLIISPWNGEELIEKETTIIVVSWLTLFFWVAGIIVLINALKRAKRRR